MATITNYLKEYKDVSFEQCPFNEMDSLFFSQLSYFEWDKIVPSSTKKIPFNKAIHLLLNKYETDGFNNNALFIRNSLKNIKVLVSNTRYEKCQLSNYVLNINSEKQFGALVIHLNTRTIYISYEGTDNNVSGWKEDFALAYQFPVASQVDAIAYFNHVVRWWHQTVYVGGHSKGGNLAMVAAMYGKKRKTKRIKTIYNFDGPGFRGKEFNSREYQSMVSKLKLYVPEESIIGLLLNTPPIYKVVAAYRHNFRQHDTNYWKFLDTSLKEGKLTQGSQKFDQRVADWLDRYNDIERKKMVYTFFEILERCEVKTFDGFRAVDWKKVVHVIKEMHELNDDMKKLYLTALKNLLLN